MKAVKNVLLVSVVCFGLLLAILLGRVEKCFVSTTEACKFAQPLLQ
jgi:hypothetical protein